ncbi:MAG: virulence RhuM family protein [Deltaproteobacteria bacterium]|nr:virulence RhuM family protein [Deltaproteobacteria bacterium]
MTPDDVGHAHGDDVSESTRGELILYETPEGKVRVEVHHEDETFWLSQRQMAELFGVEVQTVIHHLKEIYRSGELTEEATTRKFRVVRTEGNRSVSRDIAHYNLDAIISVGYRVNSAQATRFRIWATDTLREFIVKGFVLDDERLKLNRRFGGGFRGRKNDVRAGAGPASTPHRSRLSGATLRRKANLSLFVRGEWRIIRSWAPERRREGAEDDHTDDCGRCRPRANSWRRAHRSGAESRR